MYCNHCGKAIQDDAVVCAYCAGRVGAVHTPRMLVRPIQGRKLAGVALAFAQYLDVDVVLMRLILVIMGIFTFPLAEIAYLAAWAIIPEESETIVVAAPHSAPAVNHQ